LRERAGRGAPDEDRPAVVAKIFGTLAESAWTSTTHSIPSSNRVVIATEDPQRTLKLLEA
jgi:hypothetical protein